MQSWVVLLRGINVGGHRKLPMKDLRSLAEAEGFGNVRTYIQSGNLLVDSDRDAESIRDLLSGAIEKQFGFAVPVAVRNGAEWRALAASNPWPERSESAGNLVMLALSQSESDAAFADCVAGYAKDEIVAGVSGGLWIDFVGGSARSAITPARLDRCAGSPVTTRNWRTVLKLLQMLDG